MEELKFKNTVRDNPKDSDILREEYVEGANNHWKIVDNVNIKVRDQYDQQDTYKACSAYWLTAIYNWYQAVEFGEKGIIFEQDDPRRKRLAFQAERWYPNEWASLQDMMSFFKKRGLIDWYVRCKTAEECKNAINNWYLIYTWSNKCSWSATSKNKEFTEWNWGGHCFSIIDYDNTGFIAINSFWTDWGKKWFFHINYDKYWLIFSTYAIIDHDDSGKLGELLFNIEYQKAQELGITNWTKPNDPATRKEVAVMVYRIYNKLK